MNKLSGRLISLDVFRGITIAGMNSDLKVLNSLD
jgi:predicted acyltransferase